MKILEAETDVAIKNEITNLFGHSRTPPPGPKRPLLKEGNPKSLKSL
jgi:hypothetical protein